MNIVSLLPSATDIICTLGLREQLVGVTHECDFPPSVRALPKVTKTLIPTDATSGEIDRLVRERMKDRRALYTLDMPVLERLRPDLIVTQALCDVCAVAEEEVTAAACTLPGAPRVVNLEPERLGDVFDAVRAVARAAGIEETGERVVGELTARVDRVVERARAMRHHPRVALLEWLDPPFSAGHWSPELVRLAGGVEGLGGEGERSRQLAWEEVVAWQPEVVLIACCGFDVERTMQDLPLLDAVPGWHELPAVRDGRVYVTNGAYYFSRPGPLLVDSLEIAAHAIDPDIHPPPLAAPPAVCIAGDAAAARGETA